MSKAGTMNIPIETSTTAGLVRLRPLGGDGYSSPQSFYLANRDVTADASGGTLTVTINMDPQFQSVIALVNVQIGSGAADRLVRLDVVPEGQTLSGGIVFGIIGNVVLDADVGQELLYSPPPLFPVVRVVAVIDNVDTENLNVKVVVYNFKRDAF